jgi:hypothetical protein
MAKRFFDTNYFNDPFILSLKPEDKLLYFYFMTICDHAGIFEMNQELGNFHLKIKNYSERVVLFSQNYVDKLIRLSENHFIAMNYCKRQYPNGVNSKVAQVRGALMILERWNIEIINYQTFTLRVTKGYEPLVIVSKDYVNVNDNVNKEEDSILKEQVREYTEEEKESYNKFNDWLFKNASQVLKLKEPITIEQMFKLKEDGYLDKIGYQKLKDMHNCKDLLKKYVSANLTLRNWVKKEVETQNAKK